jgi:hypothetical protein
VRSLCGQSGVTTTPTLTGRMNCYSPWSKASGSCLHSTTPSWCQLVQMVSSSECYSLTQCLWSAQITRLHRFRRTSWPIMTSSACKRRSAQTQHGYSGAIHNLISSCKLWKIGPRIPISCGKRQSSITRSGS